MFAFDLLTREFDGKPLTTLTFRERPAWVARHIGALLGYAGHGKRLVNKILGEWNAEFEEGHDYVFLEGEALAAFRAASAETPAPVSSHARSSLLLLLEPGLHLVLTKTHRPVGVRLRRFLANEVLPQLARTGSYTPGELAEGVAAGGNERAPDTINLILRLPLAERREARLWLQVRTQMRWVSLCERRFQVAALHRVSERLGESMHPAALAALEITIAEISTGLDISSLLGPPDDDDDDSTTASQRLDDEQAA